MTTPAPDPLTSRAPSDASDLPPVPTTEEEIDELRREIDRLDAEILSAIQRRTEVSKRIGATRMASGGPRIVYSREMAVLDRFADLGVEGRELAMMLLRLGRGRLGGR
ncbi:MAG: chorismate mutase [Pseudonocardia sediminis]